MIKQLRLGDLIHERISLRPLSTGWETTKCPVCNDYKERGSFLFDGEEIRYSCFNCGIRTKFDEFSGKVSKNFRKTLNAFGIEDSEISAVVNTAFFNKKPKEDTKITLAQLTKVNTSTPPIKLPPKSFELGHSEFLDYQEKLVKYLLERNIDLSKYKFFFSLEQRFINRIIIPFYRNGQLIYWQARSIDPAVNKRYDNAAVGRDAVMFGYEQLNRFTHGPLFITEGVFDAMVVDGVAILGSKLNDAKVKLLKESPRRLIFVIDKDKNGRYLAEDVLSKGWEITFAPDGSDDINHSISRFGLTYTIHGLMKSVTKEPDDARLKINLNCR